MMKLRIPGSSSASAPPSRIPLHLPSPTMEAPPPAAPPTAGENIILCTAAALPVILAFIPILMYLVTGSIEKAVKMFRMPTMAAALTNSLVWLFYCMLVQRVDPSWIDVTTANAFLLVLNYYFLMLVWAHKRSVLKGLLLSVIVIPGITYLFVAMRWKIVLPNTAHIILGTAGILSQLGCYTLQVWDSVNGQGGWEAAVTAINFFPSMVLNFCVGYVTWIYHPEQFFLWISSGINCVACTMGLMMLVLKVLKDYCKRRQEGANHNNNNDNHGPGSGLNRRENIPIGRVGSEQTRVESSEISVAASLREPELPLTIVVEGRDHIVSASLPAPTSSPVDGSSLGLEAIAALSALSDEYDRSRKHGNQDGNSTSNELRKTVERFGWPSPVDGSSLGFEAIAALSALSDEYQRSRKHGNQVATSHELRKKTVERSKEEGNQAGNSTSHELRKKTGERADKSRKLTPAVGTRAGWFCTPVLRRRVPATRDQGIIV